MPDNRNWAVTAQDGSIVARYHDQGTAMMHLQQLRKCSRSQQWQVKQLVR